MSTAACWITAPSAGRRFRVLFMPGDKQASSCYWGLTRRLNRQIHLGKVKMYTRTEMLDVVMIDGHAKGIVTRNLIDRKN